MVIATGVISAAAISRGSAGYIAELVDLPFAIIVPAVVLLMGAVAAWGILQSVMLAGLLTVIEIGGLLAIIAVGAARSPDLMARVPEIWTGIGEPDSPGRHPVSLAIGLLRLHWFRGARQHRRGSQAAREEPAPCDLPDAGAIHAVLCAGGLGRAGLCAARRAGRLACAVEPGIPACHRRLTRRSSLRSPSSPPSTGSSCRW